MNYMWFFINIYSDILLQAACPDPLWIKWTVAWHSAILCWIEHYCVLNTCTQKCTANQKILQYFLYSMFCSVFTLLWSELSMHWLMFTYTFLYRNYDFVITVIKWYSLWSISNKLFGYVNILEIFWKHF